MSIKGKNGFNHFKHEIGKHCLQRIPPTERNGRTHTSIVSVAVLPIRKNLQYQLKDSDIEIQTTKGSGPGGQHKNKTETAVRMIHRPTGLRVFIDGRSQSENKKIARSILEEKVCLFYEEKENGIQNNQRYAQIGQRNRSNKIRTYNFKKNRVVNHITGAKTTQVEAVMNGRFDLIV